MLQARQAALLKNWLQCIVTTPAYLQNTSDLELVESLKVCFIPLFFHLLAPRMLRAEQSAVQSEV